MKKVLLAAIVLMSTQAGFSQISKGQWLLGGTAGFASEKHGTAKNTDVTFSPNVGLFFADNLAAGIRLNVMSEKPDGSSSSSFYSIAPFARYYFLPAGKQVNVFADGEYGFGSISNGSSAALNEFTISAGPAVFLSPSAALEFALYYSSYGGKAYGSDRDNTIGLRIGFQIHLGGSGKK